MNKLLILLLLILGLITLLKLQNNSPKLAINNIYFTAEIAKTESEKEIGLAKYKSIKNNFALIFPFDKSAKYAFWMKGMKFPIDIIYVNDGKIVQIFRNIAVPKNNLKLKVYRPKKNSNLVVEINAGLSDLYHFKEGSPVNLYK